jgi:hypothetical protein
LTVSNSQETVYYQNLANPEGEYTARFSPLTGHKRLLLIKTWPTPEEKYTARFSTFTSQIDCLSSKPGQLHRRIYGEVQPVNKSQETVNHQNLEANSRGEIYGQV